MQHSSPHPSRNYFRRSLGLAVCLSPFGLLSGSLVFGLVRQSDMTSGLGVMVGAALLGAVNFHLSFVRPFLFRRRRGSVEQYRHVSGLPLIGTLAVLAGGLLGFGAVVTALLGVAVMLVDTGGSFWFLLSTWKDSSFWDA